MAGDLQRGVGALKKFQSQVNTLLTDLEKSAGGSAKVAEQTVSRSSFSGSTIPFAEADGFYTQYNRVHTALVALSKSLSDQIELLSIAVHGADIGYDNVEEDMRRRFHEIQARLQRDRDAATERRERDGQKPAEPAEDRQGVKSGTTDLG